MVRLLRGAAASAIQLRRPDRGASARRSCFAGPRREAVPAVSTAWEMGAGAAGFEWMRSAVPQEAPVHATVAALPGEGFRAYRTRVAADRFRGTGWCTAARIRWYSRRACRRGRTPRAISGGAQPCRPHLYRRSSRQPDPAFPGRARAPRDGERHGATAQGFAYRMTLLASSR